MKIWWTQFSLVVTLGHLFSFIFIPGWILCDYGPSLPNIWPYFFYTVDTYVAASWINSRMIWKARTSVADPDPPDPKLFFWSGSGLEITRKVGSGSAIYWKVGSGFEFNCFGSATLARTISRSKKKHSVQTIGTEITPLQISICVEDIHVSAWCTVRFDHTSTSYFFSFDFCTASEENSPAENLGQVVFGERIRPSPYKIEFGKNTDCQVLTGAKTVRVIFYLGSAFIAIEYGSWSILCNNLLMKVLFYISL